VQLGICPFCSATSLILPTISRIPDFSTSAFHNPSLSITARSLQLDHGPGAAYLEDVGRLVCLVTWNISANTIINSPPGLLLIRRAYVLSVFNLTISVRPYISTSAGTIFAKFSGLVELWLQMNDTSASDLTPIVMFIFSTNAVIWKKVFNPQGSCHVNRLRGPNPQNLAVVIHLSFCVTAIHVRWRGSVRELWSLNAGWSNAWREVNGRRRLGNNRAVYRQYLASSISMVTFSSDCGTSWLTFKLPLKKVSVIML